MLGVNRTRVLDSASVLYVSNVLSPEEGLVSAHDRSDLESSVVVPLVSSLVDDLGVEPEGRSVVVALSPVEVGGASGDTVVSDVQALLSNVSDVSLVSIDPSELLIEVLGVVVSGLSISVPVVWRLTTKDLGSLVVRSDGLSSGIEGPDLSLVKWVEGKGSNVRVSVSLNSLSVVMLGSDSELNSISKWVSWERWSCLSIDRPSLVLGSSVAERKRAE